LYVGFTTPGGKLFFPVLASYANVPEWFTLVVSKTSKLFLEIAGYPVYQKGENNITIQGSKGVTIAWGCLGIGAISLWLAFIAAHYTSVRNKLKWIITGIILIFILNIARIDMIALSNYHGWSYFQSFNAHTSFDVLTYIIILIMMAVFVRNHNRVRCGNA